MWLRADLAIDVQLLQFDSDVGDVGRWAWWWAVIRTINNIIIYVQAQLVIYHTSTNYAYKYNVA